MMYFKLTCTINFTQMAQAKATILMMIFISLFDATLSGYWIYFTDTWKTAVRSFIVKCWIFGWLQVIQQLY